MHNRIFYFTLFLFAYFSLATLTYSQQSQAADSTYRGDTMVVQGITFVSIPGGTFQMGSKDGEYNERPVHMVTVSAFEMSATEITVGQFRRFVQATGYKTEAEIHGEGYVYGAIDPTRYVLSHWTQSATASWINPYLNQTDDHPVTLISWDDAIAYCRWLSEQTGEKYDLPTEAEWEYACRAGTTTKYYTGNTERDLSRAGWYGGNSNNTTHTVGQKEPNAFGLYDMHGNVMEWCKNGLGKYKKESEINPQGPAKGSNHVIRGGYWVKCLSDAYYCRSAFRVSNTSDFKYSSTLGFRIVRRSLAKAQ